MNIRAPVAVACLLVLAGCASVKDVAKREPVFFGSTARTAADYVQCVDSAWKGQGVQAARQPIHNGYQLVVEGTMGVEALLTAETWKGKTEAKLYTRIPRASTALAEAANLCR
jgi:hypothetical protein